MDIRELLTDRILVLDGAMGTMIQQQSLTEADYRGARFRDVQGTLKGNHDLLVLTQPDIIRNIHVQYLVAGADIIETNTFNANSVSLDDYLLGSFDEEINFQAARLAKEVADIFTAKDPSKPRFVAGAIGPTNKTASISPDVNSPAFRAVTFDTLYESYFRQIKSLLTGGVDVLLIETIFDTLNAKAALLAADDAMRHTDRTVPIMLSVTLAAGGRTLSGQTIDAFLASVMHANILSVGFNCSFGAHEMRPFLKELSQKAPYYISAYPNAGLPNRLGEYDETPDKMANEIKIFFEDRLVNIIGGCCGTTPEHIAQIVRLAKQAKPHQLVSDTGYTKLSGLELLSILPINNFINIGERCNVTGSRKFIRLIQDKKYEEALHIARKQVENGAQIIDINMDDALLDCRTEMITFLNLIAGEPDICEVPVMIDSSDFEVIEAGLKCIQGKSVVNSISLKDGEKIFLERARKIKALGAAVVVMAFDEKGQADSFERKIEICERAYSLLVKEARYAPYDIIFDPNVLAIGTGIKEHDSYGIDFIKATAWIKQNLPGAKVSGGISNLSFAFRGNNYIREVIHAVFLFHAINAGLDMGIVNPAASVMYSDIPSDLLSIAEDVVLNRSDDATERLIEFVELHQSKEAIEKSKRVGERAQMGVDERLISALRKGSLEFLEQDLLEALTKYSKAVDIIDGPLMTGMNQVGELFSAGKMFLPQVVKTARTMKKAVEILQPVIELQKGKGQNNRTLAKYLLATVKGDVHDIGKNIVGIILSCNNFEVIDLGIMVSAEKIIQTIMEHQIDFVGLSGLITPSLEEMSRVAAEMQKAGLQIPLMIGGAATSAIHTALKIAPQYNGPVFHVKDAVQNPLLALQLLQQNQKEKLIEQLKEEQAVLRQKTENTTTLISYADACQNKLKVEWDTYSIPIPHEGGIHELTDITIAEVRKYINWTYFFKAWKVSGELTGIADIQGCDTCRATWLAKFPPEQRMKASQAMQLYKEANRLLDKLDGDMDIRMSARFGIFPAFTNQDTIYIDHPINPIQLPCLRQQKQKGKNEMYLSLSDMVMPFEVGKTDYIGTFVVSVGCDFCYLLEKYKEKGDDYQTLLLQSLGDRLVEATSEWLHKKIRTQYWGYAPDENLTVDEIKKMKFRGIRPAIGYPSLPDHSLNFELDKLLDFKKIGVVLTEHGAMYPNSTISGLYLAHPQSSYFMVGPIDQEQKEVYAKKRKMNMEQQKKFLH